MQAIAVSHMTKDDVVIGISHSGSSTDIIDVLKIARANGTPTISITNKGKSPITKHSDIVLYTSSNETKHRILGLNSLVAQLAIINTIYYYIICKNENATKMIDATEESLQHKKY